MAAFFYFSQDGFLLKNRMNMNATNVINQNFLNRFCSKIITVRGREACAEMRVLSPPPRSSLTFKAAFSSLSIRDAPILFFFFKSTNTFGQVFADTEYR